jgi:phosphocarrier protein
MVRRPVTIINKLGLHARAAAKLVATASEFESTVQRKGRQVDAKSIMPVMMLAASQGTEIELIANGSDEAEAIEALSALVDDYFGEGE